MDSVKLALVRTNLREWQHCLYREGEAPAEPKQARQEPRSLIGTLVTFLTRSNSFTLVCVNGRDSARRDSPSTTRDVSEGPARPSLTLRVGIFHSAARLCSPITQITEKREKRKEKRETRAKSVFQIISWTNRAIPPSEIQWDDSPIGVKSNLTRASCRRLSGSSLWRGRLGRQAAVYCIREPIHH